MKYISQTGKIYFVFLQKIVSIQVVSQKLPESLKEDPIVNTKRIRQKRSPNLTEINPPFLCFRWNQVLGLLSRSSKLTSVYSPEEDSSSWTSPSLLITGGAFRMN